MTALRFSLLVLLALFVVGIGAVLLFDPSPVGTGPHAGTVDSVIGSGTSLGIGMLISQLMSAIPSFDGGPGAPFLLSFSANQPTAAPPPAAQPVSLPTLTPAPTSTRGPTNTPAPTRAPVVAVLTGCGDINQPGTFSLAAGLHANGDCLNIRADNVVLDCKSLAISGSDFSGYGIAVRTIGLIPRRPNNIEVRNCNVSGFHYGIYVDGSTNLYIHDNIASGNFNDVDKRRYGNFLGMAEGGGIRLNNSIDARVENNTANDQAIGIDIRGSSNVKVRGNQANNNTAWGIDFWQTSGSEISGNATASNIRYCTWGAGDVGPGCDAGGIILQNGSSSNVVSGNQVTGGNGNGIFIKAHAMPCGNNNVIANNTITGALYNAIEIGFCTGTQIVGNTIDNSLDGIWMGFTRGVTIKNNSIQNQRNHGIIASHSHDNTISNNNFVNDNEALYFYWEPVDASQFGWIDVSPYRSFNNCLCNNTFSNNANAAVHLKNSTSNQITGNTLNNNRRNYWLEGESGNNNISGNNVNVWLPAQLPPMSAAARLTIPLSTLP